MKRDRSKRRPGTPGATMTGALALLLVICLAECATEQRLNSRGDKATKLIQKVNGWRSQRGGSCLSYGHSCWGAHGKRSGKPPAVAPDWFLTKLFRQVDSNTNAMNHDQQASRNNDMNAIYRGVAAIDSPSTDRQGADNEDFPMDTAANRNPEAKPMLDDNLLAKIKLWQILREASMEQ